MSTLNPRYIHAVFCDDVRAEIGGKVSLMGLYQGTMQISADSLPVAIPKLCVVVEAKTPQTQPFEKLRIRVLLNETVLAEGEFPHEQLKINLSDDPMTYRTHGMVFSIQPFVVEAEGILRVRAETETGEIRAGGIKLMFTPETKGSGVAGS